jgi:hypothetical protein
MWTADMPTSKECRQHAEECLRLANETTQIYARQALLELAAEFREIAKQLETRSSSAHGAKQRRARPAAALPTRRRRACGLEMRVGLPASETYGSRSPLISDSYS